MVFLTSIVLHTMPLFLYNAGRSAVYVFLAIPPEYQLSHLHREPAITNQPLPAPKKQIPLLRDRNLTFIYHYQYLFTTSFPRNKDMPTDKKSPFQLSQGQPSTSAVSNVAAEAPTDQPWDFTFGPGKRDAVVDSIIMTEYLCNLDEVNTYSMGGGPRAMGDNIVQEAQIAVFNYYVYPAHQKYTVDEIRAIPDKEHAEKLLRASSDSLKGRHRELHRAFDRCKHGRAKDLAEKTVCIRRNNADWDRSIDEFRRKLRERWGIPPPQPVQDPRRLQMDAANAAAAQRQRDRERALFGQPSK